MTRLNASSHARLSDLVLSCQEERRAYRSAGIAESPACVEIFRRAFGGDQEAWAAIRHAFEPLMRAWVGVQHAVDPDDVLQEALLAFARWAPQRPELVAGDQLGRPLAFLRQCTKTALLMQLRSARRQPHLSLERLSLSLPHDPSESIDLRLAVYDRIRQLITSPEERLVFDELLVYGLKPQDIFQRHRDRFADMDGLRTIIQRILRRLRNDSAMQEL